jgi:hypothetical protein
MLRKLALVLALLPFLTWNAPAQVPVEQVTVTGVTASLDKLTVKAGETVPFTLKFNAPFPRRTSVQAVFRLANPTYGFAGIFDIPANQQGATIQLQVDAQADAGDYVLDSVTLASEKRQPIIRLSPPLVLHVIAVSGTAPLPTAVTATIDLTKRQYLLSQSSSLEEVRNTLATQIDGHPVITSAVLQNLIDACQKADQIIRASETTYLKEWSGDARLRPVFFDDFHQRFLNDIILLREQQQAITKPASLTPIRSGARLVFVQTVKRRPRVRNLANKNRYDG